MKSLSEIQTILKEHKEDLKRKYGVTEIAVFGSVVRDAQTDKSDVDILVEFDETPDLLTFIELERYLEELLSSKVDLVRKQVIRKELENKILKEMVPV